LNISRGKYETWPGDVVSLSVACELVNKVSKEGVRDLRAMAVAQDELVRRRLLIISIIEPEGLSGKIEDFL
jgi:hypothetical protein